MNRSTNVLIHAFKLMFKIACFAAFVTQLVSLTQQYFKYSTRTRVEQHAHGKILIPHLAVCTHFTALFLKDPAPMTIEQLTNMSKQYTVADLFINSPAAHDSLAGCAIRSHTNPYLMQWMMKEECLTVFEIRRFYMQEYLCYQYRWRKETYIVNEQVSHSLLYRNVLYILSLSERMSRMYIVLPILFPDDNPTWSRMLAPKVMRRGSELMSSETVSNMYEITYTHFEFHLLPLPYRTRCIAFKGTYDCASQCLINHMVKQFDKLPFSELIFESDPRANRHHFNQEDLSNKTARAALQKAVRSCEGRCHSDGCVSSKYSSRINSELRPEHKNIRFFVMIPDMPATKIFHEPKIYPVEFVVILLSCFGTWYGMSVIAFNPFDLRMRRKVFFMIKRMFQSVKNRNIININD